ncbi:MAG: patatin-like phospholipase family protein, partial [Proteobacteria bacterium]|nr:patatin-like phospholipase family protein [Pseudomonadota bacterium]
MAAGSSTRSAQDQLRRDERAAILRRRRRAGLGNAQARQLPTVGLALSGGGVRSATFGLGLLRGLAEQRLLARVDYLSTISGGGYVGAMLGRLVSVLGLEQAQQLLAAGRSDMLDWLRSNGRYLTPAGARDVGILIVSYLRAFLAVHIEAFFALALVALAVTLPHLLQDGLRLLDATAWEGWPSPWFALALLWSAAALPCLLVAYWAAPETRSPDAGGRHLYPGDIFLLAGLLVLALVLTWNAGLAGLLQAWRRAEPALPLLVLALWSAAVGHAGAMAYLAHSHLREPRQLTVARLRSRLTYGLRNALLWALLLAGAGALDWASWTLLLLLTSSAPPDWVWGGLGLGSALLLVLRALAPVLAQLATQAQARHTLALGPQLLNLGGHLGGLVLLLAWLVAVQWWVFDTTQLPALRGFAAWMRWAALALLALLWWLTTARLPQAANASSLAGFYQARLVRAWLAVGNRRRGICTPFTPADMRRRNVTEVVPGDDVELMQHRPEAEGGALHLIGSCLNQTRDDASGLFNADRKGQLAIASARALEIGPEVVRWEQGDEAQPQGRAAGTLGGWVAVSGAAAAPGAGAYTSRGWALVMFLLGIRLGRWIAAPLPVDLPTFKDWLWRRAPKPLMLWSEARATFFGMARPWWYLSDGGHFDNTGVYALIKRECDFIILSDASADPDYRFADIENLVRKARIDLDAEIEFYARQEAARFLSLAGDGLTVLSPDELADNSTRRGV